MSNQKTSVQVGLGFLALLGLLFITLKLCGVIAWSWLWVLSPFWVPLMGVVGMMATVAAIAGVMFLVERR